MWVRSSHKGGGCCHGWIFGFRLGIVLRSVEDVFVLRVDLWFCFGWRLFWL